MFLLVYNLISLPHWISSEKTTALCLFFVCTFKSLALSDRLVGVVIVSAIEDGLYVLMPDYDAMEAASLNTSYGEQTRYPNTHTSLGVEPLANAAKCA